MCKSKWHPIDAWVKNQFLTKNQARYWDWYNKCLLQKKVIFYLAHRFSHFGSHKYFSLSSKLQLYITIIPLAKKVQLKFIHEWENSYMNGIVIVLISIYVDQVNIECLNDHPGWNFIPLNGRWMAAIHWRPITNEHNFNHY